jgi:hypothetical protein
MELLLAILDLFFQKGKQINLSSDRMLMDMQRIYPQVLYRFKGGTIDRNDMPEYQVKIPFFKNKYVKF